MDLAGDHPVKMEVYGLDELAATFERLGKEAENVQKKALYAGAGTMKDELISTIQALPDDDRYVQRNDSRLNVVGEQDKQDLISHVGIASFEMTNDGVNTQISFDGYGTIKTKKYPQGRPVIMIARSINSGSSVRQKIPFVRKCANSGKQKTVDAMKKAADEALKELVGGK